MTFPARLPLRLVLIAGIVAALGLAAVTFTRLTSGGEAETPRSARAAPRSGAQQRSRSERVQRPSPTPRRPVPAPAKRLIPLNGLPVPLATALAANEVVVVSLFTPGTAVDSIVLEEARAGAAAAGAGFVAISVLEDAQTRPLLSELGVLEAPAVLVYRRPKDVALRVDGYADRETIAQAADTAARTRRRGAR